MIMGMEIETVLERIASKLDDARHGYDYGEMNAEQAFSAAVSTVQQAIRDVLDEIERERRAATSVRS